MTLAFFTLGVSTFYALASSPPLKDRSTAVESSSEHTRFSRLPTSLRWEKESAWQPEKGEIYVSPLEAHFAPASWVTIHSMTFPWFFSGSSLGARFRLMHTDRLSIVGSFSYFSVDLGQLFGTEAEGVSSQISFVPTNIVISWRWTENILLGASLRHNEFIIGGETIAPDNGGAIEGVASTTNSHLRFHIGWAMSDKWSCWFISNSLLNQSLDLQNYNQFELENGGTVEVFLEVDTDVINFTNSNSLGIRLQRRTDLWMFNIGFDAGRPPFYLLGTVTPISFLPHLTTGFYF